MLNLFTNIPGTNQPLVGTGGFVQTSRPSAPTPAPTASPDKDSKFLKELKKRGYTAEQAYQALQEVKQGKQPQIEAPKPEVEETGFVADVKRAAERRVKQGDVIASTEQTGLEKFFQEAGQGAAFLGDVAFAGIKAATPESVKEGLKSAGSFIAEQTPESVKEAGMEAAKQGMEVYSEWKKNNPRAALNLEATVNIGSLLPIGKAGQVAGKGAEAAKEVAKGATEQVRKEAAKRLLKSAEESVSKALAPTKQEMKMKAAKIAPEFVEKGIVGSRETILKKAEEGIDEFGKKIESYISEGKLKGTVSKEKVTSVIDEFASGAKTKAGVVLDEEKILLADRMRSIVDKFGDAIPADEAKSALRVLGEMTARKKGFTTGAEKISAELERGIYGALARELAKANPELDQLNKAFSFYKNLADVTKETIERTAPQSGMFRKAAATLFAGQGQGVIDTAMKYVGSKLFLDFVSGPFYETMSARVKRGLADAIYSGNTKAANGIIKAVKSGKTPIVERKGLLDRISEALPATKTQTLKSKGGFITFGGKADDLVKKGDTGEIKIDELILTKDEISAAKDNISRGLVSQTEGPIEVYYVPSKGKYEVSNGYHRIVEAMARGDKSIKYKVSDIFETNTKPDNIYSSNRTNTSLLKLKPDSYKNNIPRYGSESGKLKDGLQKYNDKVDILDIYENEDSIFLNRIQVKNQGQGIGSSIMKDITSYADNEGKRIELTPEKIKNTSKSELVEFYKRFGFVENKGKNKDFSTREEMYRNPR